jgi:hypothetical protein
MNQHQNDTDFGSDGDDWTLTTNELHALVRSGTFYSPAGDHHGLVHIRCDHCDETSIDECLGMPGDDKDLCLWCAVQFVVDTYCVGGTVAEATARVATHTQFAVCSADSAHAAEWTAIVLRTDASGVVCGGDSGYLASLGRVAGVVEND